MVAISKSNLNTSPYNVVLSILKNSSYIKDPRLASVRNRKFIYRHEPDTTSFDFSLYPFIVCKPPVKNKPKPSADRTTKEIQWEQTIMIKTLMNGSGMNKEDVGIDDMLTLMDQFDEYFESTAVRKDFKDSLLNFQNIETIRSLDQIIIDGKMVYETEYRITYRSRVCVK